MLTSSQNRPNGADRQDELALIKGYSIGKSGDGQICVDVSTPSDKTRFTNTLNASGLGDGVVKSIEALDGAIGFRVKLAGNHSVESAATLFRRMLVRHN